MFGNGDDDLESTFFFFSQKHPIHRNDTLLSIQFSIESIEMAFDRWYMSYFAGRYLEGLGEAATAEDADFILARGDDVKSLKMQRKLLQKPYSECRRKSYV